MIDTGQRLRVAHLTGSASPDRHLRVHHGTDKFRVPWKVSWLAWLGKNNRYTERSSFERTRRVEYDGSLDSLCQSIENIIAGLSKTDQYIIIEVDRHHVIDQVALRERLHLPKQLKALVIRYNNRTVVEYRRNEQNRILIAQTSWETGQARVWMKGNGTLDPTISRFRLVSPWIPPDTSQAFPEFLRTEFEKVGAQGPKDMRELIRRRTGRDIREKTLGTYLYQDQAPEFDVLVDIAFTLGVDVRHLIGILNRRYDGELKERDWASRDYPLFVSGQDATFRLLRFRKEDPEHRTSGWFILSERLNPFNFLTGRELARLIGLDPNTVCRMEGNQHPAKPQTIVFYARALRTSRESIVEAVNRTFFGDTRDSLAYLKSKETFEGEGILDVLRREFPEKTVRDLLADLFPGQTIVIHPSSQDLQKIISYARNPGTPGQFFFAYRKARIDLPAGDVLSGELERRPSFWDELERNEIPLNERTAREWFAVFDKFNLPRVILNQFLGKSNIKRDSVAYLLAEALVGRSLEDAELLYTHAGNLIGRIFAGEGPTLTPEVMLTLACALPSLDRPRFFQACQPDVVRFFPELESDPCRLTVRLDLLQFAMEEFDLTELLFSHRMDHQMTRGEMGNILGVNRMSVRWYEKIVEHIDSNDTLWRIVPILAEQIYLKRLSKHTGRDLKVSDRYLARLKEEALDEARRIIYLHFRPQVLQFFDIIDPVTNQPIPKETLARYTNHRTSASQRLREGLKALITQGLVSQPKRRIGELPTSNVQFAAVLRRLMNLTITSRQALSYVRSEVPLSVDDIVLLKDYFPDISARKWFETMNGAPLAYFLGRRPSGVINYDPPKGINWSNLKDPNRVRRLLLLTAQPRDKSGRPLHGPARRRILEQASEDLKTFLDRGNVFDTETATMSRQYGLDPRLLYLNFRHRAIRKILEADGIIEKNPRTKHRAQRKLLKHTPGLSRAARHHLQFYGPGTSPAPQTLPGRLSIQRTDGLSITSPLTQRRGSAVAAMTRGALYVSRSTHQGSNDGYEDDSTTRHQKTRVHRRHTARRGLHALRTARRTVMRSALRRIF